MSLDLVLNTFRAIGEETRLRVVLLLNRGELTVSELTQILGQSQPRVSRHLKILADAGLVERHREGAWIFYRLAADEHDAIYAAIKWAVDALGGGADRVIARDIERFDQSRESRAAVAAAYFKSNADDWDRVRGLHIAETEIEARMRDLLAPEPIGAFVDFGTGTGRMLSLFSDDYETGFGFDLSREMLAVARANLERDEVQNAQVRLGDIFSIPLERSVADVVCIHQVLHFLAEPTAAVAEAARLLRPGGRLIISDFAPHDLEFLREDHAHRRLGFSDEEVAGWCRAAGLAVDSVEALAPAAAGQESLTVKIWLCRSSKKIRQLTKNAEVGVASSAAKGA